MIPSKQRPCTRCLQWMLTFWRLQHKKKGIYSNILKTSYILFNDLSLTQQLTAISFKTCVHKKTKAFEIHNYKRGFRYAGGVAILYTKKSTTRTSLCCQQICEYVLTLLLCKFRAIDLHCDSFYMYNKKYCASCIVCVHKKCALVVVGNIVFVSVKVCNVAYCQFTRNKFSLGTEYYLKCYM